MNYFSTDPKPRGENALEDLVSLLVKYKDAQIQEGINKLSGAKKMLT